MKPPVALVVPGSLDQRTGGYVYDRRIALGLRGVGWTVEVHELAGRFPQVDAVARRAAGDALEAIHGVPVIDGLALPAFAEHMDRLPQPWIALIHHPLALETGLSAAEATGLGDLERRLLARAARIIVTSPETRRGLATYDVEGGRVGVVCPGTDPAPLARGSGGSGLALLCVATLTPRKGHLDLLDALGALCDLDWRLTCVGSAERDPATRHAIDATIARRGLEDRVHLAGERTEAELRSFYDRADLVVLASYHEGYGMALAEALAWGLPIVSTTAGAIPDTVPADAGLLVPPGDPAALSAALRRVMTEPETRASLATGARKARRRLPGWGDATLAFAAEINQVSAP